MVIALTAVWAKGADLLCECLRHLAGSKQPCISTYYYKKKRKKENRRKHMQFMLQGLSGNVFKGLDCVCVVLCAGIIACVLAHVTG